jgi:hypothetical protein
VLFVKLKVREQDAFFRRKLFLPFPDWTLPISLQKNLNSFTFPLTDAGYRLVEEQETGQAPVYAIGGEDPQPAKVTRRVNVVKRTDAQKVCFGIEDTDILQDVDAAALASPAAAAVAVTPSKEKAEKTEKKKDKKKKKREEASAEPDTEQKKKKSKKK